MIRIFFFKKKECVGTFKEKNVTANNLATLTPAFKGLGLAFHMLQYKVCLL